MSRKEGKKKLSAYLLACLQRTVYFASSAALLLLLLFITPEGSTQHVTITKTEKTPGKTPETRPREQIFSTSYCDCSHVSPTQRQHTIRRLWVFCRQTVGPPSVRRSKCPLRTERQTDRQTDRQTACLTRRRIILANNLTRPIIDWTLVYLSCFKDGLLHGLIRRALGSPVGFLAGDATQGEYTNQYGVQWAANPGRRRRTPADPAPTMASPRHYSVRR